MDDLRLDGIYYYHDEDKDLYYCYKFRETGVLSFAVKQLDDDTIRQGMKFPSRGAFTQQGTRRMRLGFSRDTKIYATVKPDDTLDVVINSDYGDELAERRIYEFYVLEE
ncbi:MAG: hypothetical protein AAFN11_02940 [Chloroflexota bacterium]